MSPVLRLALAVLTATLAAPALLVIAAIPVVLLEDGISGLGRLLGALPFVVLVGSLVSGPIVLVVGVPLYLVLRRIGRANAMPAIGAGALVGAALLIALNDTYIGTSFLGAAAGGGTGYLFLRIAGRTAQTVDPAPAE